MLSASHPCPSSFPVTAFTIETKRLLTKKPRDKVLRKRPVLIVFIPLGDLVMKKSSCPVYMKASPEPTRKNCGINKNTLIGRVPVALCADLATDNLFLSDSAAAAIPIVDKTRPIAILCRLVKPMAQKRMFFK